MKKIVRAISIVSLYLFIVTLMPMNFIAKEVLAFEKNEKYSFSGEVKYNEESTWIKNKYNITGKVLEVEQYVDYSVVVTSENMYIIKDGKARTVALEKANLDGHIIRQGKDIYFTSYYDNTMEYDLLEINSLKINLDSNKSETIPYKDINFSYDCELQEINTDKNKNNWISVLQYNYGGVYGANSDGVYKLLMADTTGKVKELAELKQNQDVHYDEAFANISFDKNNNAWFQVSESNYTTGKNQYKLGRVSNDGSIKYINFEDSITNYKIVDNGDKWVVEGNDKVIKVGKDDKVIKNFITKDTKDIAIDKDGGVWILDENSIKKLENDKFVTKHSNLKNMNNLSVYDSNKIIASNSKGIVFINGKDIENIIVDNYIKHNVVVVKDNNDKIKILSNVENTYDGDSVNDSLNVSEILKDGSIKSDSIKDAIFYTGNLNKAKAYNEDIYIPYMRTIYKLSRAEKQEFAVLFSQQDDNDYGYILDMEIGNKGEIYSVTNKNIYKTDKNGASQSVNLDKISKNNKSSVYRSFYNLLKINNGDLYAFVLEGESTALYNVKDIDNIKEDSNYILNKNGVNYYPSSVFLNENDELEFAFLINDEYKIYKRVNNSLVEDSRFSKDIDCYELQSVKKSNSGDLFVLDRFGTLYVKARDSKYFEKYMNGSYDYSINNIEIDKQGSIYIGTRNNGLIYYDSKLNITKKN